MLDAFPRQVGNVQQAIDTAQVYERTVIGNILDHALNDLAFLEVSQQRLSLSRHFCLDDGTPRHHHVVTLAIEFDDLELELLAFEVAWISYRPYIDQ